MNQEREEQGQGGKERTGTAGKDGGHGVNMPSWDVSGKR